jgi:glycosyltransferase involved in cell wall biosynthesis
MTILHLVQKPQLRGAEIFAAQLANHTQQHGHRVILVSLFPGQVPLPFEGTILSLDGKRGKRLWNIKAWRRLAHIIQQEQPDVIQANAGDTLKYAVFSKLLFRWKQPIIFRNASTISLYIKTWPVKKWNGFFFRYACRIVSVCKASATDFEHLFPKYKKKVVVVPIGIEEPAINRQHNTGLHTSQAQSPVLVHVGGFTYEKNHIRLIPVFQQLLKIYPDASLRLIGDGPLKKDMEEVVKQKGLGTRVLFYGARTDVNRLIAEADALLLPSIIEGLPGVILEAFYCKIPVVAYDVGGIGEVLINHDTGHLVKSGDELAFVNAVCEIVENKQDSYRMANNAYNLVTSEYLNKWIARKFISVYESVKDEWEKVTPVQKPVKN